MCKSQSQQKNVLPEHIIPSYIAHFLIFYQQPQYMYYLYDHIKRVDISWIFKERQKNSFTIPTYFQLLSINF